MDINSRPVGSPVSPFNRAGSSKVEKSGKLQSEAVRPLVATAFNPETLRASKKTTRPLSAESAEAIKSYKGSNASFMTDLGRKLEQGETLSDSVVGYGWTTDDPNLKNLVRATFPYETRILHIDKVGTKTGSQKTAPISVRKVTAEEIEKYDDLPVYPSISIGGPSALVRTVKHGIDQADKNSNNPGPAYIVDNWQKSAAYGSGPQFVPHHVEFSEVSFVNILKDSIKRVWSAPTLKDTQDHKFGVVDVDWDGVKRNPLVLIRVVFGFIWNAIKGLFSSSDTSSRKIEDALETGKLLEEIDPKLINRTGGYEIAVNAEKNQEFIEINEKLKKHGLEGYQLSPQEAAERLGFTPDVPPGGGLWFFPKSGSIASSFQDRMVKRAKEEGCEVQQGWRLQEVLTSESGKETYGVKIVNTETGATKVMRSEDVYTSLGKAGTWDFQDVSAKTNPQSIISATGITGLALYRGEMNAPILSNGVAFTPVSQTKDPQTGETLTLVRLACGGVVNPDPESNQFQLTQAARMMFSTQELFGANKVQILTAKACARPMGASGTTSIVEPISGFSIGTGGGGTGMTTMAKSIIRD